MCAIGGDNPDRTLRERADGVERSPEGVDLTLIRWMLSLTHTERLEVLQRAVSSLDELRHARLNR